MKPLDDRQLERLLTPHDDPQPPADLLDRIQAEIPDDLAADHCDDRGRSVSTPAPRRPVAGSMRRWLPIAATVLVALGAAMLAWRVRDDVDPRADHIIDESPVASAPTQPVGPPAHVGEAETADTAAESEIQVTLATPDVPEPVAHGSMPAVETSATINEPNVSAEAPPAPADEAARSVPARAETKRGNLYGQVVDSDGVPIPGATLEVGQGATKRELTTDGEGRFGAQSLPADLYRVISKLDGFWPVEYAEIPVREGLDTTLEVTMSPVITDTITVSSGARLLDQRQSMVAEPRAAARPQAAQTIQELRERAEAEIGADTALIWVGTEADISFRGGSPRVEPESPSAPTEPSRRAKASTSGTMEQKNTTPNGQNQVSEEELAKTLADRSKVSGGQLGQQARFRSPATDSNGMSDETLSRRRGAPYDATTFRDYGTSPFVATEDDARSTFALDVDTASYNVVRRFLRDGYWPDPAAVRVEEMVNAFDYGDAPPAKGDFAVHIEAAPLPFEARAEVREERQSAERHLLRFAIAGREVADRERPPVDLILVVDTSGSMAREDRLGLVKDATRMLIGQLGPNDRVALVAYNQGARIALLPTRDLVEVERCLASLRADGSTNAAAGLRLGYRLAADYRRLNSTSRVLLLSDGVANVGNTTANSILAEVAQHAAAGVELTTVGVGMGNYNDVLLEQLANRGDGRYAYVDDRAEARRIFVETLSGTLTTIASEAKVQVVFDPEVVTRYRLIGYENRAVADRSFRDDRVDAGEVGAGHTVVALYEVELAARAPAAPWATLHLRYRSEARKRIVEERHVVDREHVVGHFRLASPAFRLSVLVAAAGEVFKQGPAWNDEDWGGRLHRIVRETQVAARAFGRNDRVDDWLDLLGRAVQRFPGGFLDN